MYQQLVRVLLTISPYEAPMELFLHHISNLFPDVSASQWAQLHRVEVVEEGGVRVRVAMRQVACINIVGKFLGRVGGREGGNRDGRSLVQCSLCAAHSPSSMLVCSSPPLLAAGGSGMHLCYGSTCTSRSVRVHLK